jgi:hypothetical protein
MRNCRPSYDRLDNNRTSAASVRKKCVLMYVTKEVLRFVSACGTCPWAVNEES